MDVLDTGIPGLNLVRPRYFEDERGYFVEIFKRSSFRDAGLPYEFVQDNVSLSRQPGTLRGMHWQAPPFAQAKLVRVARGAVLDMVVDLRRHSSTYGQHFAVELSAENRLQLLVPRGFAHGFLSLEPDSEVIYKCDALYQAAAERGVHWADPDLALPWPERPEVTIVSDKDRGWPRLRDLDSPFADGPAKPRPRLDKKPEKLFAKL
jgi:dTDP-4-dehydrorhamnose 3,5-epimerase